MSEHAARRVLIIVAGVGLLVRFLLVISIPSSPRFPDSREYVTIAENLLENGRFENKDGEKAARTPVYPMVVAATFSITGQRPGAVRALQCVIDTLSILLLFLLVLAISGSTTAGLLGASFYAVYPSIVYMSGTILTEPLVIFFLLSGLVSLLKIQSDPEDVWPPLISGASFGMLALTHPSYLLLPPVLFVVSWAFYRQKTHAGTFCLVGVLAFFIMLSPWILRNRMVLGGFVPGTTTAGKDLIEAFGPGATGGPRGRTMDLPPVPASGGELAQNRYLIRKGLHHMFSDPLRALRLGAIKFARTWSPIPNYGPFQTPWFIVLLAGPYLFCLTGVYFSVRGNLVPERLIWILMVPILYVAAVHAVFIGSIRYRIPVMPLLIGLSATGFVTRNSFRGMCRTITTWIQENNGSDGGESK